MNADFDDARRGLERLALYTPAETAGVEIQRLGGLTNRVFMVSGPRGRHVLRIPGNGTETYINRRVEAVAARAAARAGVSPRMIATTDDGLMLTVAIENAVTMTP
jgi:thiamine kinase-like enzyme